MRKNRKPAAFIGIGIVFGAGVGIVMGNILLGAGIGLLVGAAIAAATKKKMKKGAENNSSIDE